MKLKRWAICIHSKPARLASVLLDCQGRPLLFRSKKQAHTHRLEKLGSRLLSYTTVELLEFTDAELESAAGESPFCVDLSGVGEGVGRISTT